MKRLVPSHMEVHAHTTHAHMHMYTRHTHTHTHLVLVCWSQPELAEMKEGGRECYPSVLQPRRLSFLRACQLQGGGAGHHMALLDSRLPSRQGHAGLMWS